MCSGSYEWTSPGLPQDIAVAYQQVLPRALALLTEQLATAHGLMDTRYLLAAAALKGHPEFGKFLNDVDLYAQCRACGAHALDLPDGLA
jgi:hypothetical protein